MKKYTTQQGKSKCKMGSSSDVEVHSTDVHDEPLVQTSMITGKARQPSPSADDHDVIPENVQHIQPAQGGWQEDGGWRGRQGGYRGGEPQMNNMSEWGGDYMIGGPNRTHWTPSAYGVAPNYPPWGSQYSSHRGPYDGRGDMRHHTEANGYYSGRGRPYGGRATEYDGQRRPYVEEELQERRYDSGHWPNAQGYGPSYHPQDSKHLAQSSVHRSSPPPTSCTQVERSSVHPGSPPPSSSMQLQTQVQETLELEVQQTDGVQHVRLPLQLDGYGVPTGKMASLFHTDIVSFSKDMDPSEGWDGQTTEAKQWIVSRLMQKYEIQGENIQLSAKFLKKEVGSALINFRYYLNQVIDKGGAQLAEVGDEYWKVLKYKRQSKESKEKSEKMANVAKSRVSKQSTKRTLEQAAIVRLTLDLDRESNNAEIEVDVQKELLLLKEEAIEKRRSNLARNSNAIIMSSAEKLQERLQLLEAFMSKWSPKLELWDTMTRDRSFPTTEEHKTGEKDAKDDSLVHCPSSANVHEEGEEEDIVHSDDETFQSEDSEDNLLDGMELDDVEGQALDEQAMCETELPNAAVQAKCGGHLTTAAVNCGSAVAVLEAPPPVTTVVLDAEKWSAVIAAGKVAKSSTKEKQVTALRFSARTADKAGKAVLPPEPQGLLSRPAKRAKCNTNSKSNPVDIDEDSAEDILKSKASPSRTSRAPRLRPANLQGKKEGSLGKEKRTAEK